MSISLKASFFWNLVVNNPKEHLELSLISLLNLNLERVKQIRKETNLRDGFYTFLIDEDPRSYKEAITSPNAPFWKEAINSEIESIMYNHTWELVDLPPSVKTIDCKWIFKGKLKQDGFIEEYKAHLVAKAFKQRM